MVLPRRPDAALVGIDAGGDMHTGPADAVTPLSPDFDLPGRADEQLAWLREAGLEASVSWANETSQC